MSVNPDSIPRYAEYPAEMDPTQLECMESCKHSSACRRAYMKLTIYTAQYTNVIADALECNECEEFEE